MLNKNKNLDVTGVLETLVWEAERETPHEDEWWYQLYKDVQFVDDVTAAPLNKARVVLARKTVVKAANPVSLG